MMPRLRLRFFQELFMCRLSLSHLQYIVWKDLIFRSVSLSNHFMPTTRMFLSFRRFSLLPSIRSIAIEKNGILPRRRRYFFFHSALSSFYLCLHPETSSEALPTFWSIRNSGCSALLSSPPSLGISLCATGYST